MTFEEAILLVDRIKYQVIGKPVKGNVIEALFIGPTNWEEMSDFMNLRIQKGEETAQIEFSHRGKSLSVYGVSITKIEPDIPKWEIIILDDWEKAIYN